MRILDVFREKTCLHTPRFPLASFHKCASALKIVVMRAGSLKAEFGFQVSIQVLIRGERWRISRKVKKLYFLPVGLNPTLNDTRVVDPRVVANNEKFSSVAPEIKDKTAQEPDEVIGIDGFALQ